MQRTKLDLQSLTSKLRQNGILFSIKYIFSHDYKQIYALIDRRQVMRDGSLNRVVPSTVTACVISRVTWGIRELLVRDISKYFRGRGIWESEEVNLCRETHQRWTRRCSVWRSSCWESQSLCRLLWEAIKDGVEDADHKPKTTKWWAFCHHYCSCY